MAKQLLSSRGRQIVTVAAQLLESEGRQALTMRRVADALGIRAPSLYKHLPDKAAIETAIIVDGVEQAAVAFEAATRNAADPLTAFVEAYRAFAAARPQLYRLMTERRLPRDGMPPGLEVRAAAPLVRAVGGHARARAAWAFVHGMVVLELGGRFPDDGVTELAWQSGIAALRAGGPEETVTQPVPLTRVRRMEALGVATVRRFSRVVTQRLGVLNEEYLARPRPLGASRVLYEIGEAGVDARALRSRLGLDSGYLSRLLRRLEGEHLVTVDHDADDHRVRVVRLTEAGRAERTELDRRSDELARTLLDHLDRRQRGHLVDAMATVERLLTAQLVEITPEDPTSEAARSCLRSYFAELDGRFDNGFDPELSIRAGAEDLVPPAGLLLLAWLDGEPVGCGALRFHGREAAEIKRMWVSPSVRGLALGRRILQELERDAAEAGATAVRLETNHRLTEAIQLYRSAGYREVSAFNDEAYAQHWFEKALAGRQHDA